MTWMQTATGRAMDLMDPRPEDIDLEVDVAEALAREPRFGGHVRSGPYSVAQHCCLGTDCILAETGSLELARAFLLHDAHEAYCKDILTPLAEALGSRVRQEGDNRLLMDGMGDQSGVPMGDVFRSALAGLKRDLDRAIYSAAGAPLPSPVIASRVREWDLAMLAAERQQLLGPAPKRWNPTVETTRPAPLRGRIKVWPWPQAADEWRGRLHTLFPHLKPAA